MKERLLNNWGLKILSIFLAFFVWLVVVNVSNPEVVRTKEVPIEVENEQILDTAKKTYEIIGKDTVTVSYRVRTRDASLVLASDFRAYIDLADLYDVTGSVPVKVEVSPSKELLVNTPIAKPGVIRVATEDLQRKRFELGAITVGETRENYTVGEVAIDPKFVYVKGPASLIGQISRVGIEIDVSDAHSDLSGKVAPVLYDANGSRLDLGNKVQFELEEIGYSLPILAVKSLLLNFETMGQVADGYQFTGIESDVTSIDVIGKNISVNGLVEIKIPPSELDLSGASGDKTVQIDLHKFLPEDISIARASKSLITVRLKVAPLKSKTIVVSTKDILLHGSEDKYSYEFNKEKIEVTLKGLDEELIQLDAKSIKPSIDVAGLSTGVYTGSLMFEIGDSYEVMEYSPFELKVGVEKESESATQTVTSVTSSEEDETSSEESPEN